MALVIGDWRIDFAADTIGRGDVSRKLERRAMAVLEILAEHPGEVVLKDELVARVWNGRVVSSHSVAVVISQLRQAFDDPTYIETITKRGYRLQAPVSAYGPTPRRGPRFRWCPKRVYPHRSLIAAGFGAVILANTLGWAEIRPTAVNIAVASEPARNAPIAVIVFKNTTGDSAFDAAGIALSNLTADSLHKRGASMIRWTADSGDEEQAILKALRWRPGALILTGVVFYEQGRPVLSVQLADGDCSTVWSGVYSAEGDFRSRAATIADDLMGNLGARSLPA